MTTLEMRSELKKGVDNLSEKNIAEMFEYFIELQRRENRQENAKRILNENKELFAKLAK